MPFPGALPTHVDSEAIAFSTGAALNGMTGKTINIGSGAGLQTGDILVLFVDLYSTDNAGSLDSISSTGWVPLDGTNLNYGGSITTRIGAAYHEVTSGEAGGALAVNYTVTAVSGYTFGSVFHFRAADGFASPPVQAVATTTTGSSPLGMPTVISPSTNCLAIAHVWSLNAANTNPAIPTPTGETGGDWTTFDASGGTTGTFGWGSEVETSNQSSGDTISGGSVAYSGGGAAASVGFAVVPASVAGLTHYVKTDNTARTTTSTSAAELTNYTISWANLTDVGFANGDDVLILVAVKTWSNSAVGQSTSFAVGFGTTFAGRAEDATSVQIAEPQGTANGDQYLWLDRRTLITNENIYLRGQTSAGTASYNEFVCFIIKLDDLDANDFIYAEATDTGDAPAAYDTAGAGATIPATGDWLLLATSRWLIDSATSDLLFAIHDGTADVAEVRSEGENTSNERVVGTIAYRAGLTGGATVRARYRTDTTARHDNASTAIFGLRLDAFEDHAGAHTTNTVTHSVLDTYQEFAGFGSYGLGTTGPFVVIGWPIHLTTEATKRPYGRIQIGGSDWPAANANRVAVAENGAADCKMAPFLFGYNASQTAGTLDIDLDCAEDADISPTYTCMEQVAAAFSLRLVGVDTDFEAAPEDGTLALTGQALTLSAGSSVALGVATLALTGHAPTIATSSVVTPGAGNVALTGHAPMVVAIEPWLLADGIWDDGGAWDDSDFWNDGAAAGDVEAEPGAGTLALAGAAPTIAASSSISPAAGSVAIVGFAPTVSASLLLLPGAGTVAVTGHSPTVTGGILSQPAAGVLAVTGESPTVAADSAVAPDAGVLAVIGFAPTVAAEGTFTGEPASGVVAITGYAPTVAAGASVTPDAGVLELTGDAPTFSAAHIAAPGTGTLAATGEAPAVSSGANVEPTTATVRLTGFEPDVTTTAAGEAQPGVGTLQLVGLAPSVAASSQVEPAAGTVVLTGHSPTVTATSETESLPQTGTLAISGHAPTVLASSEVAAGTGTLAITGYAPTAGAGADVSLTIGTGTLVVVGHAPEFAAHFTAAANDGGLVLAGFAPTLTTEHFIEVGAATIAVTGYAPLIVKILPPARRVIPVSGQDREVEVAGRDRLVPVDGQDRRFAVTGRRRVFRVGPRGGPSAA